MTHTPVHFLDAGSGRPIFLLHAFPMDHTMWDGQVRRLQRRYRVIAPNAFGFGRTPLPVEPWSFESLAHGLLALADSLRLRTFVVAGLSMGGYTAFEMLREAGERIDALVLANTRARDDTDEERQARAALTSAVERGGVAILKEQVVARLLKNDPAPGLVDSVHRAIERATPLAIQRALAALAQRADSTGLLDGIRQPVLALAGTEDAITSVAETREWAGRIDGCRIVEIPGAGHLSNIENASAFNDALEAFLLGLD